MSVNNVCAQIKNPSNAQYYGKKYPQNMQNELTENNPSALEAPSADERIMPSGTRLLANRVSRILISHELFTSYYSSW